MSEINLGNLTVPLFTAVFGMGWGSCWSIVVLPLKKRVDLLEAKMEGIEQAKDERIAALEKRIGLLGS